MFNKTIPILVEENKCCGCYACYNICPNNAIEMIENDEHFLIPKINEKKCIYCKKCITVCPVLNLNKINYLHPQCYAIRASDSIRKNSSSGGLFYLLAEYFIDNGGYVCGAAYNKDFYVEHIIINSKDKIKFLQGSKYVQSNINNIFKEIKKLLLNNKKVFFTGTPCQIAGLKNFLEKDYINLFTADIICHGVPSQYLFRKHIFSIEPNKEIKDIRFRDKRFGWTCLKILIEYKDGSIYIGDNNTDAYERIFHPNLALRLSCADCKFSEFPRHGDISMGDFWGYEIFSPQYADSKGTSMAFINSDKGEMIFKKILRNSAFYENISYTPNQIKNRIFSKYPAHTARQRFFAMLSKFGIEKSSIMSINGTYDICLVGIPTVPNFGGSLTYYALYHVLEDLGYSTLIVERPLSARTKPNLDYSHIYIDTPFPSYSLAKIYKNKDELRQLNKTSKIFIIGSDQLFNYSLYKNMGEWCTLDWVSDSNIKIAYAASFGHDHIWGDDLTRAEMSFFMKKFDFFSVREISAIKLAKEKFDINATNVLDPVFLCKKEHYINISGEIPNNKNYISAYLLDKNDEKINIVQYCSQKLHLNYEIYSEIYLDAKIFDNKKNSINYRLNSIIYSDFVITDSFHGTCFAIIFHKNFITIRNKKRGTARFDSILTKLNLSNRIVDTIDEVKNSNTLFSNIDWKEVDFILEKEKLLSISWLYNAIKCNKNKSISDYDILTKKIKSIDNNLNKVYEKIALLKNTNSALLKLSGFGNIMFLTDIYEYLKELTNYNQYIFISVKDTLGFALNDKINKLLSDLKISYNLTNKHWHSFIAVIFNKNIIFEKLSNKYEDINYINNFNNHNIQIISSSFKSKNIASIKIDNYDYSINGRGLNIVIWDCNNNIVIDSVCFDTHLKTLQCKR